MRRGWIWLRAMGTAALLVCLFVFGAATTAQASPETLSFPDPPDGWQDSYIGFLDENYTSFARLWPEGVSGVGFIDLDLDGTPEMAVFDQGGFAAMGVHLFDLIDGQVYCVSSGEDRAAEIFGGEHLSDVDICANYFESFRLSLTEDGWRFWIMSASSAQETSWDEIIRFDASEDGVLTSVSVCARYLVSDIDTGLVVEERYTAGGETGDSDAYQKAAAPYLTGQDAGYEARGVFLWNDLNAYDGDYNGLLAMARDAADSYVPVP